MHQEKAAAMETVILEIREIQKKELAESRAARPVWPVIGLRSPKGWTGPKEVDGKQIEGTFRAHQVPVTDFKAKPAHLKILEDWMRGYRPQELFDETGKLIAELAALAPKGNRRMGANPVANGGLLLKDLNIP